MTSRFGTTLKVCSNTFFRKVIALYHTHTVTHTHTHINMCPVYINKAVDNVSRDADFPLGEL